MLPGFCADMAVTPYRVFLGTLPHLAIEERFLRQLQPVFPWYTSRKRVKEQANEFIEIDLASCDPELLLRYNHVYYVRRNLFTELVEKQLTWIETGKAAKLADNALMNCLTNANVNIQQRLQYELHLLQQSKRACNVAGRRELDPNIPFEPCDYLCMMRVVEEDHGGIPDAEMQARAYLPRTLIEEKANHLTNLLLGSHSATLDKRENKLLQRMIPADYNKVGAVEKLRPIDVATYFRFVGERVNRLPPTQFFKKAVWGHIYRKFASHPAYLCASSMYWACHCGLDPDSSLGRMPSDLAVAACMPHSLFPALKFRSQFLYTSPETARQLWRTDSVVPLLRLYSVLGAQAAEDLAACMVVEGEWAKLQLSPVTNPLQDNVLQHMRQFVDEIGSLYESNIDAALKRVDEGVGSICLPLTDVERRAMTTEVGDEMGNTKLASAMGAHS